MPYTIKAQCPCCKCEANGVKEISKIFGWRDMENGETIPQSYCNACRGAKCVAGEACKVNSSK